MKNLKDYGLSDRYLEFAAAQKQLTLARVIAQNRGIFKIATDEGECPAELSGRLRHEIDEPIKYPTVGDYVMVSPAEAGGVAAIQTVLPRKSLFLRKSAGTSGQLQAVAANIDILFICMSLNANFNLSRLERYLSAAWDSGARPVVVLTKADLCEQTEVLFAEVERVAGFADVVALSAYDESAVSSIAGYLKPGVTAALVGSSGVGKSTLINRILGDELLATADIGRSDKGRHTTTGRQMLVTPFGAALIDTPGMREFGTDGVDLSKSFGDIELLAERCRFSDCTHTSEPGCAVLAALESGELDRRRYTSFLKLRNESSYDGLSAKSIEVKKAERMFKGVGGMKNVRKAAKGKKNL